MSLPSRRRALVLASLAALTLRAAPARATYSIAAFDRDSGRFGGVTASCVPLEVMRMVYAQVPGAGAVLTQSYLLPDGAARAFALGALAEGQGAEEVLAGLTDAAFDVGFELRQYAVLDASGGVASFTGSMAEPFAGDALLSYGAFEVAVAGNFLSGEAVLLDAAEGFAGDGCDLEARLMDALIAASAAGQGDARCVEVGVPAQSALIQVARADGDLELEVGLPSPPSDDPVAMLAAAFEAWRDEHPCPQPEDASVAPAAGSPPADGGCGIGTGSGSTGAGPLGVLLIAMAGARLTSSCRRRRQRRRRHP